MAADPDDINMALVDRRATIEIQAEHAKTQSAIALAMLTVKATQVVDELLEDEDPQVRARAVELVYSRTIPKVAAKHMEEAGDVIDSADVASLRESIIARIKGNGNG